MATLVLRTVKGSELTWQEADDNFTNLNTDITNITNGTTVVPSATTASTATTATNVTINDTTGFSNDTVTYPLLVANLATGAQLTSIDNGLSYNASTNNLSASIFTGAHNGTVGATTPSTGVFTQALISGTSSTGGFGYSGSGTGGTATQLTSRTTSVTLARWTGQITLFTTTLAADTTQSFTLTNSLISATDLVLVQHVSGGTLGAYGVTASAAAGSATIYVRNITPTVSASEAPVIKFMVIKATTA